MLQGKEIDPEIEEQSGFEASFLHNEPVPVSYNPALPIETFDFIVTDECHRSIYNLWQPGWRLVSGRKRKTSPPAPGALACSRKLRAGRVAHVSLCSPLMARCHRRPYGSSAEAYAARPNLHHNERVRQRADGFQAR